MNRKIILPLTILFLSIGIAGGEGITHADAATKKVAINKKNFPDQVFRELVRVNYDKNKDKKLSEKEIKKAKQFATSSCKTAVKIKPSKYAEYKKMRVYDIHNFKGIEKLTNLRKFVANYTDVETINLKKNKKLTYLEMEEGKLTTLNLNQNKKLKSVYLAYNRLTTLKINKCKKLLYVDVTGHMVTNLKIDRNKKTKVTGEKYYTPYTVTSVNETFSNPSNGGQMDGDGAFCVYEWADDLSSCVRKTMKSDNTGMDSTYVTLNDETITTIKSMQTVTAQWKDSQGNFYVLTDRYGNMADNSEYHLLKVDQSGALKANVNVTQGFVAKYKSQYTMTLLSQTDSEVVFGIDSNIYWESQEQNGIVCMDLTTMTVTKQASCNFIPKSVDGDLVAGFNISKDEIVTSKIVEGTEEEAPNGEMVNQCQLSGKNTIYIKKRSGHATGITICDGNVYAITGEGFFQVNLKAGTLDKVYTISNFDGIQSDSVSFYLNMQSKDQIYLMLGEDTSDGKEYTLQIGSIK